MLNSENIFRGIIFVENTPYIKCGIKTIETKLGFRR